MGVLAVVARHRFLKQMPSSCCMSIHCLCHRSDACIISGGISWGSSWWDGWPKTMVFWPCYMCLLGVGVRIEGASETHTNILKHPEKIPTSSWYISKYSHPELVSKSSQHIPNHGPNVGAGGRSLPNFKCGGDGHKLGSGENPAARVLLFSFPHAFITVVFFLFIVIIPLCCLVFRFTPTAIA